MLLYIGIFYFYPKQRQTMKKNLLLLAAAVLVLGSCGSKSSAVSATATEPVETKSKPAVAVAKDVATDAGKAAYENHCAKCHDLFKPKDFTKEQWAPILVSMQKKARLSDAEMAPITAYIYTQL